MANNEQNNKIESKQVVQKPGKLRKKSEMRKFADSFIAEDANNVGSYIMKEVLIPSAKKLISDIAKNAIDMFLYGDTDNSSSRRRNSKVSYREYYDDRERSSRDDRGSRYRQRVGFEYEDVILDTRGEVEIVFDKLQGTIDRYGFARVADLYEFSGIPNDNYTLNDYGWTSLRNARYKRIRDGYLIIMPKAIPID